ncbi:glycerophosphodiester phosphodiesterase [Pontibacillus litoralis]|uniref:GP-PDE domain-containing protein n=1 Tax=Pontibacillus litoralis JSM 072002 TaxID=1385512 RepID=A0A0A5G508_9BACI|nr:glycerophosphodiester phosphodiesterase [Pontibacillus litoralis]KGX86238.1 hypothetical protein N784_05730 [Pontibacillus litoralis JSM 072002]
MKQTYVYAHRGSSGTHPENTLAAFRAAIQCGADGIELDVQMTKDGEVVVIHDEQVDRTTNGEGWICDMTYAQLATLDAGSWFDPAFSNEQIPTLNNVLTICKDTNVMINIELKNDRIRYEGMEKLVVQKVRDYHMEKQVVLSSFFHESLTVVHRLAPELETAILYERPLREPWKQAIECHATAIHAPKQFVSSGYIIQAKKYRQAIRVFTVNIEKEMKELCEMKVDAIITDFPEQAIQIL